MAIHRETFSWNPADGFTCETFPIADEAQLVIIFASGDLADAWQKPLKQIADTYSNALVVGCSSAGEILDTRVTDASIVAIALRFETTHLRGAMVKLGEQTTDEAVKELTKQLDTQGLKYTFVLSDGLAVNGSELAATLRTDLSKDVLVTGGLAGDGDRFQYTTVFYNGAILKDAIIAVGFYGDQLKIGHGSLGGWDPFGPTRTVTKSAGNVLYELDNQSALELYKRYLGTYAENLPASGLLFPLSVTMESNGHELVRTLLAVNEQDQSMTFAGSIPEGSKAKLMKANFDRLVDGAIGAAALAVESISDDASVALLISCVGRKMVLRDRIEEEVEAVREVLGDAPSIIGFYSYGELSPVAKGICELHNQTMTITTLTEI